MRSTHHGLNMGNDFFRWEARASLMNGSGRIRNLFNLLKLLRHILGIPGFLRSYLLISGLAVRPTCHSDTKRWIKRARPRPNVNGRLMKDISTEEIINPHHQYMLFQKALVLIPICLGRLVRRNRVSTTYPRDGVVEWSMSGWRKHCYKYTFSDTRFFAGGFRECMDEHDTVKQWQLAKNKGICAPIWSHSSFSSTRYDCGNEPILVFN